MQKPQFLAVGLAMTVVSVATPAAAAEKPAPAPTTVVKAPQPTVPEIFTLEGQFVRVAYNNEGFVTLGYRLANDSVGDEWMLLQAGVTLRQGVKYQTILRDAFSLKTPDGKTIPLATQKEYGSAGYLPALNKKATIVKDSLNYFPVGANRPCAFQLFADLGRGNPLSFDQVDLADNRACVGRLFFKVPGGIAIGQHWLVVKFAGSEIQVPFRILTKEETKEFSKRWEDLKKELDEGMLK
jgi:hypothetical protein